MFENAKAPNVETSMPVSAEVTADPADTDAESPASVICDRPPEAFAAPLACAPAFEMTTPESAPCADAEADAAPVSAVIVVVGNCPVACADVPAVAPRAVIATDGPNDGDARTEAPALAESGVTATAPPKAALIVAPAEALAPSGWTTTPRSAP